jgi:hypothetical protein
MPNTTMKVVVDLTFNLHLDFTKDKRKDNSCAREATIESHDDTMNRLLMVWIKIQHLRLNLGKA